MPDTKECDRPVAGSIPNAIEKMDTVGGIASCYYKPIAAGPAWVSEISLRSNTG